MRGLLFALVLAGCATDERPLIVVTPDGARTEHAPCRTGCAAQTPDEAHDLGHEEIGRLMDAVADAPVGVATLELETLLFHGAEASGWLDAHGDGPLDAAHAGWLRSELARDEVDVAFRLVGDDGQVHGDLQARIPLVEKQHLLLRHTGELGRMEIGGKVKRVGLGHLWSRF